MSYLYETHLHTDEGSDCGRTPAREYIPYYLDQGYRGIVVTDHFYGNTSYMPDRNAPWKEQVDRYCLGYELALDEGIKRGLDVFFGIEQYFGEDECLIYGLDKQWLYVHPDCFRWGRKKMFDEVEAAGGCIVHAHPFRVRDYVTKIVLNSCVHAVECFNACNNPMDDLYAIAFAKKYNLPMTAGSDIHKIGRKPAEYLYGVIFEKPWTSIMDYASAVRERKPFGLKYSAGRDAGEIGPLQRPWEFRDKNDRVQPWSPEELFEIE